MRNYTPETIHQLFFLNYKRIHRQYFKKQTGFLTPVLESKSMFIIRIVTHIFSSYSYLDWPDRDFEMIFAYSRPDWYRVRLCFKSLKSTWNKPKRTLNPSAHSKLSIRDHAKYPRTLIPSSCIAIQGQKKGVT